MNIARFYRACQTCFTNPALGKLGKNTASCDMFCRFCRSYQRHNSSSAREPERIRTNAREMYRYADLLASRVEVMFSLAATAVSIGYVEFV